MTDDSSLEMLAGASRKASVSKLSQSKSGKESKLLRAPAAAKSVSRSVTKVADKTAPKIVSKKAPKKAAKKTASKTSTKKAASKKSSSKNVASKKPVSTKTTPSHPKGVDERLQVLEKTVSELTRTVHKLEDRIKAQQQEIIAAQHQLEYASSDTVPRVVHELAWYIKSHLDSWSEEKIVSWLREHGHEEMHIRQALALARTA